MGLIKELEKKSVKVEENYFSLEQQDEKLAVLEGSDRSIDIKIDEDYIKPHEESMEGKDTTFSEDDVDLKSRAKRLEKELAGIMIPEFKALWKTHSAAFNDYEVDSESAFKKDKILSLGYGIVWNRDYRRMQSEGKASKLLAKEEQKEVKPVKKVIKEEMCSSINIDEDS